MTGSLQTRKGKYIIVLSYKDENQKWRTKQISTGLDIKNNKRRAEEKLDEILEQYKDKSDLDAGKVLFSDFVYTWLELRKPNIQITTYNGYKNIHEAHLKPYFSALGLTLEKIKPIHIQQYYAEKQKSLSSNSVLKHHVMIKCIFGYAKKMGLISQNAADIVEKPKKTKHVAECFNRFEISNLLEIVKDTPIETPVILACYLGLRRSEILGIKWSVIDFQSMTLTIKHKVVPVSENGKFKLVCTDRLKTDSSYRTLPINQTLYEYLLALKDKQEENKKTFGNTYNLEYEEYVCVNVTGDILLPNYVTKAFKDIQIANGFQKVIRFHDLRHSAASILLSASGNMKDVQWLLGHGNISTTMDIYGHLFSDDKRNIVDGISEAIKS